MTQFECAQCGGLIRLDPSDRSELRMECPVCEEETTWTRAFEGEGVSF
jgi:Zn finger protein HypA/HybF involved in hydrogenase expression